MAPLRWGIASAGKISHDFTTAVGTLPSDEHQIVAVAARKLADAQKFATLHGIETAHEGYEALAKNPNVDAVYIGAVNNAHYEIGLLMLEHGKHLLCEKPLCLNEGQSKRLLQRAAERKLFLMEAIWSRFFPHYRLLRERIGCGELGEVREVDVEFGFVLADIDRLRLKSLGGGTVLDLGVYTIQVCLWAFGGKAPTKILASGVTNEEGVDLEVTAELHFPGGGIARMKTSALKQLNNEAVVKGSKASITLHDFWCPLKLTDTDGTVRTDTLPPARYPFNFQNSCGLRYEAEEARQCIRGGRLQSESVSHADSLLIARIQDEIRKQVGVVFPEDAQFAP
ncbi:trans-1,2-dihydrobenzene-1,2-diol dehydrogenase-like [Anopheles ziemanni]|uniref:trans-1,2-dihydrobenzene-1,2-diol dehydrogenase-like n=1 Tax=Anopheles coustani TaxID=139045 RepID=UPI00265A2C13|nr:trans-1,2-dihydrobenzene-1,2-diol dehydrogenase-like [Anopheles coustani]XP_058170646.1 trans-1,2-dihydrobenzene-1,2-diol dehydrogenase-like [Anopheles ziemanni]